MTHQQNEQTEIPFLTRFVATGFFAGYSPVIPGTAGSLVGLLLYAIPGMENTLVLSCATIVTLLIGVYASHQMEKKFGEDPQIVVVDEIVGMWISLLLLPKGIWIALLGFFFFRVYDTIKPPPARQFEHLGYGWGVMMDDVAAGAYANITVQVIYHLFPNLV